MTDDSDIWQRIRDRDEVAFESLYRANAGRLCAYLRQIVPGVQLAEDLMQETFTSVWQSPNGFQPERGSLRFYLFGMARRRAADWWRSHSRDQKQFQSAENGQDDKASSAASFSDVADSFSRCRKNNSRSSGFAKSKANPTPNWRKSSVFPLEP